MLTPLKLRHPGLLRRRFHRTYLIGKTPESVFSRENILTLTSHTCLFLVGGKPVSTIYNRCKLEVQSKEKRRRGGRTVLSCIRNSFLWTSREKEPAHLVCLPVSGQNNPWTSRPWLWHITLLLSITGSGTPLPKQPVWVFVICFSYLNSLTKATEGRKFLFCFRVENIS